MRGLYPIVDVDTLERRGISPRAFAERVLRARPPLLQLRAKHATGSATLSLLRELVPLCAAAGTALYANDRPDLAVLAPAQGVHVGQDDLPVREVRRFAPELQVGVSTHDLNQLEAALASKPNYVAFGPVFATPSKQNHEPVVGLAALERAAELSHQRAIPLVAIGGIGVEHAAELARLGVIAAVIGALVADSLDEVEARALEFQARLSQRPA